MNCNDNHTSIMGHNGCYIIGPTGPTGPTGPQGLASAMISVASTITGEPGTDANVYNSGTEDHVQLNFVIPRGETGPIPHFEIGTVTTGEEDTSAQVTIIPIYQNKENKE